MIDLSFVDIVYSITFEEASVAPVTIAITA